MDSSLTPTSYAILGLLAVRPWTTYELAKQVQRSLGWFWPRAERKLYDEPKRLLAAGFATATDQRTGRRPKTVYAITPAGRRALRHWLGEEPAPPTLEIEALVKVFFADAGTLDQLRGTLRNVAETAQSRTAQLRAMVDPILTGPYEFEARMPTNALALRFNFAMEEAMAQWAGWALEQTSTWHSPTDVAGWDWRAALT
ncbi:MAG TPA: PadR family transcriptional regulator [Sporichthyaceae bacterium]|jgi:DNA-binding PadR family transcriptional regulator